jgi:hypothetical protein
VPELPEVETVRRGLELNVVGRPIADVRVLHPRAVRRQLAGAGEFETALAGRTMDSARRRGKYLWLSVGEDALLAHLGMSGQLLVGDPDRPVSTHVRIWFTFKDSGPDLRFTDQRTFGHMCVVRDGAELPAPIAHIAPDPFEAAFDPAALARRLRARRTGVKRALLDQSLVSGGPGCTGPGRPRPSTAQRSAGCWLRSARCSPRPWPPAGPRSTTCTSTSTGRAGTSSARSRSTGAKASTARGAARPCGARSS